ncbi:uncharacterized protein LOC142598032 [Dermatophagoides farinae]|uniref:uncharacterized protein LOC142598032 n=1 Tax=Dermatophagoides farinae TaxID=6954 RepID=UPI003F61F085
MSQSKADKGAKKAKEKEKLKIIEDKTFGLKNKNKSKAVQNYISSLKAQVLGTKIKTKDEIKAETTEQMEKRKEEKQKKLASSLEKAQKAMQALNAQMAKAKEAKAASSKIDIYSDPRDLKNQTMDSWTQEMLEDVIKKRHGEKDNRSTTVVCKYFLEALEKRQYGWFWVCPNGEKCMYRHALPPGYVLKSIAKKTDEEPEPLTLEEVIENKRSMLKSNGTPVTLERFLEWKEKRKIQAAEEKTAQPSQLKNKQMSGRALFEYNSDLFRDDEATNREDEELSRLLQEAKKAQQELEELARDEADQRAKSTQEEFEKTIKVIYNEELQTVDESLLD